MDTAHPHDSLVSSVMKWKVHLLQWVFPFALFLFIFSFFWDFTRAHAIILWGKEYSLEGLLRTLSVSSLIGYSTNWIAIKMLFYPQKPHPILGQGLIPATKQRIAKQLAENLTKTLLNAQILKTELASSQVANRIMEFLLAGMENVHFRRELAVAIAEIAEATLQNAEVRQRLKQKIKEALLQSESSGKWMLKLYFALYEPHFAKQIDALLDRIPHALAEFVAENDAVYLSIRSHLHSITPDFNHWLFMVLERLPIQAYLEKQLLAYEEGRLERWFWSTSSYQFRYLRDLGGLLGFLGGLILWNPIMLIVLATLLCLLFLLDWILRKMGIDTS